MSRTNGAGQPSMREQAQRLPALQPGVVVTIPLDLLPIYLQAQRRQVMTLGEVRECELASGQPKPAGVLYVRREDA